MGKRSRLRLKESQGEYSACALDPELASYASLGFLYRQMTLNTLSIFTSATSVLAGAAPQRHGLSREWIPTLRSLLSSIKYCCMLKVLGAREASVDTLR